MQCCRACPGVLKSLRLRLSTQNVFFSFKRLRAEKSKNYKLRLRLDKTPGSATLKSRLTKNIPTYNYSRIMTFKGTYVSSEQRV